MNYLKKLKSLEELKVIVDQAKCEEKVVVQCHGCFDILHPGHLRHLVWAKTQGDLLVVTASADHVVQKGIARPYVPQNLRAENLAAIEAVDYVAIDDGEWAGPILELLKPNIYVKGKEFEDVYDGRFGRERRLVEAYGGTVRFSSGDVVYSSTHILEQHLDKLEPVAEQVQTFCKRHGITERRLRAIVDRLAEKKVLVVGEVIVDKYVHCDALGMSADSPALVVRPRETETFLGGAGTIAEHAHALGAESLFLSVVGDDAEAEYVRGELQQRGIPAELVVDRSRPTIVKTCYLSEGKKLLNINVFRDHNLDQNVDAEMRAQIERMGQDVDAVVIADFSYGVITGPVLDALYAFRSRRDIPVVGDVQCSSQMGNVARLKGITLATPSEREARISLCDRESGVADLGALLLKQTQNQAMIITLGGRGMIIFDTMGKAWSDITDSRHLYEIKQQLLTEYLPSFARFIVDPMGTGDALLATLATSLAAGATIMEAAYLGSCAAAVAVGAMGNVPVSRAEVLAILHQQMAG